MCTLQVANDWVCWSCAEFQDSAKTATYLKALQIGIESYVAYAKSMNDKELERYDPQTTAYAVVRVMRGVINFGAYAKVLKYGQ